MAEMIVEHEVLKKNVSAKWVKGTQVTTVSIGLDSRPAHPDFWRGHAVGLARTKAILEHTREYGPVEWDRTVITEVHSTGRVMVEIAVAPEGY